MTDKELERRFREKVDDFRREFIRFAIGAAVLSIFFLAAFLFVLLFVLMFFRFRWGTAAAVIVVSAIVVLILGLGYWRARKRRLSDGRISEKFPQAAGALAPLCLFSGFLLPFSFLAPFYLLASLPFHFWEEIAKGRHLFGSEEVLRIAFEILLRGGDKVDEEYLMGIYAERDESVLGAVQLLLEMKLYFLMGKDNPHLVRTIGGQEFMEELKRPA
jgi:MFS family permease